LTRELSQELLLEYASKGPVQALPEGVRIAEARRTGPTSNLEGNEVSFLGARPILFAELMGSSGRRRSSRRVKEQSLRNRLLLSIAARLQHHFSIYGRSAKNVVSQSLTRHWESSEN